MNVLLGLVPLFALTAQTPPAAQPAAPASDPTALLKWSMDKYKGMKSFRANFRLSIQTNLPDVPLNSSSGTFVYQPPNLYKVVARRTGGSQETDISDGKTEVKYSSAPGAPASKQPAAADPTRADANGQLGEVAIMPFFGGSANLTHLADTTKKPIAFGDEIARSGLESIHKVLFYGVGPYGNLSIGIGEQSGTVYSVAFDLAPEMEEVKKMLKDNGQAMLQGAPAGPQKDQITKLLKDGVQMNVTEEFLNPQVDGPTSPADFVTELPKGVSLDPPTPAAPAQPAEEEPKPPVPIGHKAPDFMVTRMDGQKVRLSSLRGHVVMIDFWATWCPPCRASLPETYRLSKVGAAVGLKVMPISDEDHGTVAGFLKANHYARPTFLDAGSKAEKLYNIQAIPTVVIIDANGKLRNYFVGGQDPKTLKDALAKAGVKV